MSRVSAPHISLSRSVRQKLPSLLFSTLMVYGALRTVMTALSRVDSLRPSMERRKLCERLLTLMATTASEGMTMGLIVSECGATGISPMTLVPGHMMGPPTDRA